MRLPQRIVINILNSRRPKTVLDAPCGVGWLAGNLNYPAEVDGIDLFEPPNQLYKRFLRHDLNAGLPAELPQYHCIVCSEGIEHLGNPLLFLESAFKTLLPGGFLLITTPNTWHPATRVNFLLRGFFRGFPFVEEKIHPGTHMHIMPWSYPQLHLYLKLVHFKDITLFQHGEDCPRHFWERMIALPQILYGKYRISRANDDEGRLFWKNALSPTSLLARQLVVVAEKP